MEDDLLSSKIVNKLNNVDSAPLNPIDEEEELDKIQLTEEEAKFPVFDDEEMATRTRTEQDMYKTVLKLQENKDFDYISWWKENDMLPKLVAKYEKATDKKDAKEEIEDEIHFESAGIALELEHERFQYKIKNTMSEDLTSSHFKAEDVMYGIIPDENGKMHEPSDPKFKDAYLDSLELKDLMSLLENNKFVKQCLKKEASRFNRHATRVNFYIEQYSSKSSVPTGATPVTDCSKAVGIISHGFNVSILLARIYYIAISRVSNSWNAYDMYKACYVYHLNMNAIVASSIDRKKEEMYVSEEKFYHSIKHFFEVVHQQVNELMAEKKEQ